jgi:hypothetical protein
MMAIEENSGLVYQSALWQSYQQSSGSKATGTSTIIALMTVAARTSKTSVYLNETTRRYIPEVCHLHTRHENISHPIASYFSFQGRTKQL